MLFSNSPVKKVVEKLNPFSQKNKISRLKFERKSDYRTFLKFIKDNTKEIEDIKIPDPEDKKRKGLMIGGGLLGLALLASFGRGKGDSDDDNTGKLKSISGVIEKAKADSRKAASGGKTRRNLDTASDAIKLNRKRRVINKVYSDNIPKKVDVSKLNTDKIFDAVENEKKKKLSKQEQIRKQNKARKNTEVAGNTTRKSTSATATIDDFINADDPFDPKPKQSSNQGKQGPTGGTRDRIRGKDKFTDLDFTKLQADQGAEEQIKEAKKIKLQDKLKIKSDIRVDRQEKVNRALNVLDDLEAESKRRAAIEDAEIKKTRSKIDKNKFFKAPEIPSNKTKKLTQFDKFNRFSNRILNSPAAKFTTFMGGLFANPKFMIIKTLMEPTPLADGTLEGKPGVGAFSEQLMFDEDMAVNIFMPSEGRESMIPFDATPSLESTPNNLQTPNTNVFIDYESNTSEDFFFIKMAGS